MPVVTMPYVTKAMSQGLSLVGYSLPGNFMNSQFRLQHFDLHKCNLFKKICHQMKDGRGYLFAYVCMYVCMYCSKFYRDVTLKASVSTSQMSHSTHVTMKSKHIKYNHLLSSPESLSVEPLTAVGFWDFYRPQTKFAKVMFLHLSVSHSVHREGGCLPQWMLGYTTSPWADTPRADTSPPVQCMLGDTGNKRAVRVPLECILVNNIFEN